MATTNMQWNSANKQQQCNNPAWNSYLYQNMLPNIPPDWLLLGTNSPQTVAANTSDIFGTTQSWSPLSMTTQPTPSNNYYYGGASISPSLLAPAAPLAPNAAAGASSHATPQSRSSVDMIEQSLASPSRSTRSVDLDADGEIDPDAETRSNHSSHIEHESPHEQEEGVERDGMIWGMKVEEYRALSARERKRVRNRISARTFRAKRKEHLSSLESTLGAKDLEVKLVQEENSRLRRELAEIKRRLAVYEQPKPY